MINSTEHEIHPAHKCKNANNFWHLTFISMINATSGDSKHETSLFVGVLVL